MDVEYLLTYFLTFYKKIYLVWVQAFTVLSHNDFVALPIHNQNVRAVLNDSLCHCVRGVTRGESVSVCEAS